MGVIKRNAASPSRFRRPSVSGNFRFFLKIRFWLVLLCVGLGIIAYVNRQTWLEKLDDKPIAGFALTGEHAFTDEADIREAILEMGALKGFFGQDVNPIQEKIEAIPWVERAVVRKIWPNRLRIWVTEYQPVAHWNQQNLITKDGTVFHLPAHKLQDRQLPALGGPDYQGLNVLDTWTQMAADFKRKNLLLKGVVIDERGAWQAVLDNNTVLKLGRGEWKSKLERFATIYPQIEMPENQRIDYVDLRYPTGAAVGMAEKTADK